MSSDLTDAIERIKKLTEQVARNEAAISMYSTGERIKSPWEGIFDRKR